MFWDEFFGIFWEFGGKFLGIFGIFIEDSLRIHWELFENSVGIDLFVKTLVFFKILSQCKEEGRRRNFSP